ncbi:hypothetical protein VTN00DRAFT_7465 [Thermoascus crustaceus]|uniref:uncharacterized protein n=1 Tax=Thermoascus crustaceus TaxID=5088 RepID=UPI003743D3A6
METSLARLPDEILHSILCYSPPRSAAALERTAGRFRSITNEPLLWRFYCQTHFKFWDKRHDFHNKLASPVSSVDWKKLYITRHLIDTATTEVLESILASQTGRIEKFHAIVSFGYDAKDTLIRHSLAGPEREDYLARSNAVLACLHRSIAVPQWAKLRNGEDISLEHALGAFDLFIPESGFGDLSDVTVRLDKIVAELIAENPDIESLTPRGKALAVASYLRLNNLTGIEPGREYHSLEHNFLGIALSDPGHNSLPLISAAIYCYVSQSVGLNARPCGFPFHVHVIIMPPPGFDMDGHVLGNGSQGEPMYMDPFRSTSETPISDLQSQLNFLGASNVEQSTFLGESLASEIVLRCGKNILNSIHQMSQLPTLRPTSIDVGGRHQSFYHVLVEDRSVRYVAEENIEIITPHISELPSSFSMVAGKHFKRWDEQTRTFFAELYTS